MVGFVFTVHAELGTRRQPMFHLHVLGPATHQLHRPALQRRQRQAPILLLLLMLIQNNIPL